MLLVNLSSSGFVHPFHGRCVDISSDTSECLFFIIPVKPIPHSTAASHLDTNYYFAWVFVNGRALCLTSIQSYSFAKYFCY